MSVRLRLSSREMASLRISLKNRINKFNERLSGDIDDVAREHTREMLKHLTKLYNRLHKATYGYNPKEG